MTTIKTELKKFRKRYGYQNVFYDYQFADLEDQIIQYLKRNTKIK